MSSAAHGLFGASGWSLGQVEKQLSARGESLEETWVRQARAFFPEVGAGSHGKTKKLLSTCVALKSARVHFGPFASFPFPWGGGVKSARWHFGRFACPSHSLEETQGNPWEACGKLGKETRPGGHPWKPSGRKHARGKVNPKSGEGVCSPIGRTPKPGLAQGRSLFSRVPMIQWRFFLPVTNGFSFYQLICMIILVKIMFG